MDAEILNQVYIFIFNHIRNKFKTKMTIFDNPTNQIDILNAILSTNDEMKDIFVGLRG